MDHLNVVVVLFWHRFLKASAVDPHLFQSCSIMGGGTPFLRMLFSKCELGHKRDGVAATKQLHSKFLFTFAGFSIIVLFFIVVGIDSPLVTARYLTKVYLSITIFAKLSHTTPYNTTPYNIMLYSSEVETWQAFPMDWDWIEFELLTCRLCQPASASKSLISSKVKLSVLGGFVLTFKERGDLGDLSKIKRFFFKEVFPNNGWCILFIYHRNIWAKK